MTFVRVTTRASARLERMLDGSAFRQLAAVNNAAVRQAAEAAERATRDTYNNQTHKHGEEPSRPGRESTHGTFASHLSWDSKTSNGISVVFFDWEEIAAAAPKYWLVEEVGTNKSFDVIGGNSTVFPSAGLTGGRIPGQRGRTLPFGLQWGVGGVYVPPGRGDGAQLVPLADLSIPEQFQGRIGRIKIRRETEGKHFIRKGAQVGFELYRGTILDEYRRVFQ